MSVKILPDELIQWHLTTSKYDRCPECGRCPLYHMGKRYRYCPDCNIQFKLTVTVPKWKKAVMTCEENE